MHAARKYLPSTCAPLPSEMLLLTAFEPFDGTGLNSSLEALRVFLQRHPYHIDGVPLDSAILPVSYGDDVRALRCAVEMLPAPPRAIVHLGQTGGARVAVERRAVNQKLTERELEPIEPGAEDLAATWPSEQVVAALQEARVPCCASDDAGTFLCNHILYSSLRRAEQTGAQMPIGFLHLPRLPEQVDSSQEGEQEEPRALPLEVLALAVEITARMVAQNVENS
jgi:pyroglutamyl-peptidase